MRLFVTGTGSFIKFDTAASLKEAKKKLGRDARTPNQDDYRAVWMVGRLWEWPNADFKKKLGVSRQTACNWRAKGGSDLPGRTDHNEAVRQKRILDVLKKASTTSCYRMADEAGTVPYKVREYAEIIEMPIKTQKKRPSDEELIKLAAGKTWWELADALGMQLTSLRSYVYSKPELSDALRQVRAQRAMGKEGHSNIDRHKIREMYNEGATAHRIAETLKIEPMSVRYWVNKFKQEDDNDKAANGGTPAVAVAGRNGGGTGNP